MLCWSDVDMNLQCICCSWLQQHSSKCLGHFQLTKTTLHVNLPSFRLGVQLGMYGAAAGPQVNTAQLDQTSPPPPPLEQHWQQSEPRHCCRNKAEAMRGDIR
jgi:hypothetical protein